MDLSDGFPLKKMDLRPALHGLLDMQRHALKKAHDNNLKVAEM